MEKDDGSVYYWDQRANNGTVGVTEIETSKGFWQQREAWDSLKSDLKQ